MDTATSNDPEAIDSEGIDSECCDLEDGEAREAVWDDVLAWVISGECAPNAPEVLAWIGTRPERKEALADAMELGRILDRVGEYERRVARSLTRRVGLTARAWPLRFWGFALALLVAVLCFWLGDL